MSFSEYVLQNSFKTRRDSYNYPSHHRIFGAYEYRQGSQLNIDVVSLAKSVSTVLTQGINIIRVSNTLFIALSITLYYASIVAYTLRWRFVLEKACRKTTSLITLFLVNASSIFVNNITPLNRAGGEPLRALWLAAQQGVSKAKAFMTIVYERYTELVPVAVILISALLARTTLLRPYSWLLLIILLVVLTLLLITGYSNKLILPIISRFSGKKLVSRATLEDAWSTLQNLIKDKSLLMRALALSSTVWLMELLRLWLIGLSVGVSLSMYDLVYVDAIYILSGLLALTPGGLGMAEGGLILALSTLGINIEKAVAIAIIERLISYGLATVTGGLATLVIGGKSVWKLLKLH